MILSLYTDGGSRGNPGPAAYGFVIQDIDSSAVKILGKCGNYLGVTTNNQAEYAGLIAGLTWIIKNHKDAKVQIYMDSLLIVNQVKREYKVKHPDIIPRHKEVQALLTQLPNYSITYVPRAQNSLADAIVNQVLDSHVS